MKDRMLWRGKRLDGGEWVQGYPSCFTKDGHHDLIHSIMIPAKLGDGGIALVGIHRVDPATRGQCTGLRDKNGTLIFEGDVIRSLDEDAMLLVIEWDDEDALWLLKEYGTGDFFSTFAVINLNAFEITGTIYDSGYARHEYCTN